VGNPFAFGLLQDWSSRGRAETDQRKQRAGVKMMGAPMLCDILLISPNDIQHSWVVQQHRRYR
jgi:hypothetical protein